MNQQGQNKQTVADFYDLMFNQNKPREAVERNAAAQYIQHNPHVADGKQAFIDYFERMAREYPGKKVAFKHVLAAGDFVVLHCQQYGPTRTHRDWGGIDIFRLNLDEKIVEHWDVLQMVPEKSENLNSMF